MKVHTGTDSHVSHTGHLFFPEDVTERVARMKPYAGRLNVHRMTQEEDHVFQSQQGSGLIVRLERKGKPQRGGRVCGKRDAGGGSGGDAAGGGRGRPGLEAGSWRSAAIQSLSDLR